MFPTTLSIPSGNRPWERVLSVRMNFEMLKTENSNKDTTYDSADTTCHQYVLDVMASFYTYVPREHMVANLNSYI